MGAPAADFFRPAVVACLNGDRKRAAVTTACVTLHWRVEENEPCETSAAALWRNRWRLHDVMAGLVPAMTMRGDDDSESRRAPSVISQQRA
jgi:hypothetical protein